MRMNSVAPWMVLYCGLTHQFAVAAPPVTATSPDGRVRIEVALRKAGETDAVPHYRVTFDGKEVMGHSRLGVELDGDTALGGPCEMVAVGYCPDGTVQEYPRSVSPLAVSRRQNYLAVHRKGHPQGNLDRLRCEG